MMKVSIVIPVYNAEKWIGRCIESICCQTYKDIEIILINDGSRDKTLIVLKDYARQDERIRIIDKKNSGTYDSRRAGFNLAVGAFIFNADADDYLEPNAIDLLVKKLKVEDADVVIGNSFRVENGRKKLISNKIPIKQNKLELLKSLLKNDIKGYVWGRLYKKELLMEMNYNPSGLLQEDTLVNLHIFAFNNVKIALEETPLYNYVIHTESANSSRDPNFIENIYNFLTITESILQETGYLEKLQSEFELFKCRNWLVYARLGGKYSKDREFRKKFYKENFTLFARKNLAHYQYGELITYRISHSAGRALTRTMKMINAMI